MGYCHPIINRTNRAHDVFLDPIDHERWPSFAGMEQSGPDRGADNHNIWLPKLVIKHGNDSSISWHMFPILRTHTDQWILHLNLQWYCADLTGIARLAAARSTTAANWSAWSLVCNYIVPWNSKHLGVFKIWFLYVFVNVAKWGLPIEGNLNLGGWLITF